MVESQWWWFSISLLMVKSHENIHLYPSNLSILVGGFSPYPNLKNDGVKVNWDHELPNWMEIHNPAMFQTTNQIVSYSVPPDWDHYSQLNGKMKFMFQTTRLYLAIYPSIHLSIHPSIHPSTYLHQISMKFSWPAEPRRHVPLLHREMHLQAPVRILEDLRIPWGLDRKMWWFRVVFQHHFK